MALMHSATGRSSSAASTAPRARVASAPEDPVGKDEISQGLLKWFIERFEQ
jgi:hypothetical protein